MMRTCFLGREEDDQRQARAPGQRGGLDALSVSVEGGSESEAKRGRHAEAVNRETSVLQAGLGLSGQAGEDSRKYAFL